jgi:hypothetical protein
MNTPWYPLLQKSQRTLLFTCLPLEREKIRKEAILIYRVLLQS